MIAQELKQCIARFEFERAFIEVLGWSKFKLASHVELPDVGRLPRGWKTRQTRARIEAAPKLTFWVHGVASLAPQVVLQVTAEGGRYIPGLLRDRISRELARLHYRPIIIFPCTESRCQDWSFPVRGEGGISTVQFSADGEGSRERLAEALADLRVTVNNFAILQNHLEVFRRIDIVRDTLCEESDRGDGSRFAMKFAHFGQRVVERARLAFKGRVWDSSRQVEIARRAKAGCKESLDRFYTMHQYLVFERAREYLKNKPTFVSEFEDYVAAGNLGVGYGFRNYDPEKAFAPSTLLCYHIDKQIGRAFGKLELPLWVPVHVQSALLRACGRESRLFDSLAQERWRAPTDDEVLQSLGLDEEDIDVYQLFNLRRLWQNRVSIDDPDFEEADHGLFYREEYDERDDLRLLEALVRLQSIPERHRELLAMRVGLHPIAQGNSLTLEEVSEIIHVTRERARQLLAKAVDKAQKVKCPPIDPPFVPAAPRPTRREAIALRFPRPGAGVRTANQYVDFLIERMGSDVDPDAIHRATRLWFPRSSLKVVRIARKLEAIRGQISHEEPYTLSESKIDDDTAPKLQQEVRQPVAVQLDSVGNCMIPPNPPSGIKKANEFVEYILDTYGARYSPQSLYRAMVENFPDTIITELQIRDKFRRRGWTSYVPGPSSDE